MEEIKLQIWNYLSWLRETGQVFCAPWLMPSGETEAPPEVPAEDFASPFPDPAVKLRFLSSLELRPEELQMVERIAAALGLSALDYRIESPFDLSKQGLNALPVGQAYVLLGGEGSEFPSPMTAIPHPRDMLREPALKKSAWDILQKLKATL